MIQSFCNKSSPPTNTALEGFCKQADLHHLQSHPPAMNILSLDSQFGTAPAPLTTSRYPSAPNSKKRFSFQSSRDVAASKAQHELQYNPLVQEPLRNSLPPTPSPRTLNTPTSFLSPRTGITLPQLRSNGETPRSSSPRPRSSSSRGSETGSTETETFARMPVPPVETKRDDDVPVLDQAACTVEDEKAVKAVLAEITQAKIKRESRRTLAFSPEKFLTSNQHVSTENERLQAGEILKKDPRHRSSHDVELLAKFLQTTEFFAPLSLPVCSDIARIAKLKKYKREEIIYREGDDATCFYIIMTGSVGTRINASAMTRPSLEEAKTADEDASESSRSYIAGVEYAGASLGSESFSSSLLPRHSSTRMAIERTELLVVEMNEHAIIMRSKRKQDEKEKMLLLKQLKVMELCTDEELWHISKVMQANHYHKNEIIFTQGQVSDRIYILQTGECRVIFEAEDEQLDERNEDMFHLDLGRLGKGTFFGELGLFHPNPHTQPRRTATVYTETSCSIFSVSYDDFLTRTPKFVLSSIREYGGAVYVQTPQLNKMVRQEKAWIKSKTRLLKQLKPNKDGKEIKIGRTSFRIR